MPPLKEEPTMKDQPSDSKVAGPETVAKPDIEMVSAETKPSVEDGAPNATVDETNTKPATSEANAKVIPTPQTPLEEHEAIVSAIRGALLSNLPPEEAAQKALQATSTHPDRDRILLSTLQTVLPTLPLESALRLIDISSNLPYPARNTISLITTLTNTLTTEKLAASLPLLQPRINTIRKLPNSDIQLIKLLRSLISRDPHAANPDLVGSLKFLIASALPVWHPSGMNKRGQYNTHVLPPVPTPSDPGLARALAAFTDGCRMPPSCEQPAGWSSARDGLRILLDAFDVGQLTEIQARVCVQAAILFQHLENDGGPFGKSLFDGGEGVALRRRVWEHLDVGFRRFVVVLLQRERRWVRWKKTMEHTKVPKVEIPKKFKRRVIWRSNEQVSETENMGIVKPSWKTLKDRSYGGGVKQLIEELKEDQNEAEEDKRKNDAKYVWRGLRALCEEDVSLMAKVAGNDGRIDLERILSKVSDK